jgi:cell division protein FtsW
MTTMKTNAGTKRKLKFNIKMPAYHDKLIYAATIMLVFYGAIMVGSASMGQAVTNGSVLGKTMMKEVLFIIVGYIGMTWLARKFTLDFLKSEHFASVILFTFIALLACLAFPATGGAHAWWKVTIAGMEIGLQPSEFAKIVSVLTVAAYFGDNHHHYKKLYDLYKVPVISIGLYVLIVLIVQKDFGSAMVIALMTFIVVMIPTNPQLKHLKIAAIILICLLAFGMFFMIYTKFGEAIINSLPAGYQKNRFLSAINPFADKYDSGYQLVNGLIAFASGGWFGKGLGNSVRKYTDFPAASTDSILSIIVEELGLVGFLVLICLFGIIIFRLLMYAKKIKSEKAKIILVGVAMYFMIHIFFNIGGVTVSLPLTGIPLLLISSGGSSTISAMMALGICQAIISAYRRGLIQ